jgi:hypothetical protein
VADFVGSNLKFFNNFFVSPVNCLTPTIPGQLRGTGNFNMFSLIQMIFWIKKKKKGDEVCRGVKKLRVLRAV